MSEASVIDRSCRVALISTELGVGGAERCLTELALRLDRTRFKPLVISLYPRPEAKRARLVERLEASDVPVRFLDLTKVRQFQRGSKALHRLLADWQTDVALSFLFHANLLTSFALRKLKSVAQLQGMRVADPRRSRYFFERRVSRRAFSVLCVSHQVAEHCRRHRISPEKLVTIPNGIDLEKVDRLLESLTHRRDESPAAQVVFVGRLDKQKGVHLIPEIAAHVWNERLDVQWTIVGDGPLRGWLEDWAGTRETSNRVSMIGFDPEPLPYLARADAVAMPSLWEGMANVALEAMSCRKPVVAFEVEGMRDLLGSHEQAATYQLSPAGRNLTFAEKMLQVLSVKELADQIGSSNRQRVEQEYSIDLMVRRYQNEILRAWRGS